MELLNRISSDLSLDPEYIKRIVRRADFYYKTYTIKKRNGGMRVISQASPELKTLQYWAVNNVFSKLPISECAFAYKRGDSVKRHANYHLGAKYILHADVKNFFGSITSAHLNSVLSANMEKLTGLGLQEKESVEFLDKICFKRNSLCIGTVSSPVISNIVMYDFDRTMNEYCEGNGWKYSRYADDFYISSNKYIEATLITKIKSELGKLSLYLNSEKTKFVTPKYKMKVTGLMLTDNGVSIGLSTKRKIKDMLYKYVKYNRGDERVILGYLAFLKDVEPVTYDNYIIKYSNIKYDNTDFLSKLKKACSEKNQ